MRLGRARGRVLRLVRHRALAMALGAALALPALWIEFSGVTIVWWLEALAYLVGATGVALLWAGFTGVQGDWIE